MNVNHWFEFKGSKWANVSGVWFDSYGFRASATWQSKLSEACDASYNK